MRPFKPAARIRIPLGAPLPPLPHARDLRLTHHAVHAGERSYVREAPAACRVPASHAKIRQTVGKLQRRHGLVMSGEPREAGYRVEDWTWEARRVKSSVRG